MLNQLKGVQGILIKDINNVFYKVITISLQMYKIG